MQLHHELRNLLVDPTKPHMPCSSPLFLEVDTSCYEEVGLENERLVILRLRQKSFENTRLSILHVYSFPSIELVKGFSKPRITRGNCNEVQPVPDGRF